MTEKQQPADASWPICPRCGHEDREWRETLRVGDSRMLFCTDCGVAWHAIIVGSYYVGEIGHGRVMPMVQNRCLKVDPCGNLRTIPPAKEEPKELTALEESRAIINYIRKRAEHIESLKDESGFDPSDLDVVIECALELGSIADRIEEGKHLE